MQVDDDISVEWVATEAAYRRRGLAGRLLLAVTSEARDRGGRTATLQASADGLSVYKQLGFRHVTTMRGYLRPQPMRTGR